MDDLTIGEIGRTVIRVENKIDHIRDDHETRLRRTERWVYALPPTLIMAAASLVVALLKGGG